MTHDSNLSLRTPVMACVPAGCAIAVCRPADCRPMTKADEAAACCELYRRAWAWLLADVRAIEPFALRRGQQLFEVSIPD